MPSLRRRLLVGTTLATATILLAAGATLYAVVRSSLLTEFDRALCEKAITLAALIEQEGSHVELDFAEADLAEFSRNERPEYFVVWCHDGTILARSPSLHEGTLPSPDRTLPTPQITPVVLPGGDPGRMVTFRFRARVDNEYALDHHLERADQNEEHESAAGRPDDDIESGSRRLVLGLARDMLDVHATLTTLRVALLLVGVLATAASGGVLAWLVHRGLRPLDDLARNIATIDELHLDSPINASRAPVELQPVVHRLNELLGRLNDAFLREKTLTSDVAHELRTPLAGLRTTLEVALARERAPVDHQETARTCLAIVARAQTLVEDLLVLARLDAGSEPFTHQRTDIAALILSAWDPFKETADRRSLNVHWNLPPALIADADSKQLRVVLTNLLENVVTHADQSGAVHIRAAARHGHAEVEIANSGCRLSPAQIGRVFDRFWRGDDARAIDDGHTGLGLALCRTIVERHGGCISAECTDDHWFRVIVTI